MSCMIMQSDIRTRYLAKQSGLHQLCKFCTAFSYLNNSGQQVYDEYLCAAMSALNHSSINEF
eukprot:2655767-Amphidinium_carterae.1